MTALPLWQRVIGCVLFAALGAVLAFDPGIMSSARHPASEVMLVGWLAMLVFGFMAVYQPIRELRRRRGGS